MTISDINERQDSQIIMPEDPQKSLQLQNKDKQSIQMAK